MNNYLLTILIPHLYDRVKPFDLIYNDLLRQAEGKPVQILVDGDRGETTIGAKRNRMLHNEVCRGRYVCFVDDDDRLSPLYIDSILKALETEPDAVGFKMRRFIDGRYQGYIVLSSTAANKDPNQVPTTFNLDPDGDGGLDLQDNNLMHLNPVRREIARHYRFPEINLAEDVHWARRVREEVKREVFVDEFLYDYLFKTKANRPEMTNAKRQQDILKQMGILSASGDIVAGQKKELTNANH